MGYKPKSDIRKPRWTDERLEQLKAFLEEGRGPTEIAKIMECTVAAVQCQRARLFKHIDPLPPTPPKEAGKDVWAVAILQGMPVPNYREQA